MIKQNLMSLHSLVRSTLLRSSGTVGSSAFRHASTSAYQHFDGILTASDRMQQQKRTLHQHVVRTQHTLQKLVRKCCRHLCTSSTALGPKLSPPSLTVSKCWNCSVPQMNQEAGETETSMFCAECGTIQDLPERSADLYFALFGLERSFSLDTSALTHKFRQLQSAIHPDKFSNTTEREQQLSADWSSLVNSAYKTLLAPTKRGEYILRQHGIEIPEGNTAVGSAFLMEMMERNEEVDDAHTTGELRPLLERVQDDLRACVGKLDASLQDGNLDTALEDVITLRYLVSLQNSIKTKINKLL